MSMQVESRMDLSQNENNIYSLFKKSSLKDLEQNTPLPDLENKRSSNSFDKKALYKTRKVKRGKKWHKELTSKPKEAWPINDVHCDHSVKVPSIKYLNNNICVPKHNVRYQTKNHTSSLQINMIRTKPISLSESKSAISSTCPSSENEVLIKGSLIDKLPAKSADIFLQPSGFESSNFSQNNTLDNNDPLRRFPNCKKNEKESMAISADINPRPRKILRVSSLPSIGFSNLHLKKKIAFDSRIIKIKYNNESGPKITKILNPPESCTPTSSQAPPTKIKISVSHVSKSNERAIHPLFLGSINTKSKNLVDASKKNNNSSLIKQAKDNLGNNPEAQNKLNSNSQSLKTSLNVSCLSELSSKIKIEKSLRIFPKIVESAWPRKGMVHVRGIEDTEIFMSLGSNLKLNLQLRPKKLKDKAVEINSSEDILISISKSLSIRSLVEEIHKSNHEESSFIPSCLRLPIKHNESSIGIRNRVQKQILSNINIPSTKTLSTSEDELQVFNNNLHIQEHPALIKASQILPASLSALDCGTCESNMWCEKYAPKKGEEVLQMGPEALILKNWLSSLTIGIAEARSASSSKLQNLKMDPSTKRKRKSLKLEGFIVHSDDEDFTELDEINLSEQTNRYENDTKVKRTVVRGGDWSKARKFGPKIHHTILISGPNGCGKTAAVHAVANELDFEVFEINSSSRRNGKDIIEKIGDMTLNHHVQRVFGTSRSDNKGNEGKYKTAPTTDNKASNQEVFHSFFKSKSRKIRLHNSSQSLDSSPVSLKPKQLSCKDSTKVKEIQNILSREQKQSFILIEEADIIFKEDSQFWSVIENIIAVSRRPIIITCNDETAIPLSRDYFYAILRFKPPPVYIAVDYLLLIAASEGHIIQREAIKALYEERHLDLRASLSELNFWCQFAIGDVNKGLSWYIPRKYSGSKKNNPQTQIRVISEGSYRKGMGWISQDILASNLPRLEKEENVLHQTSNYWNLDLGDWGMSKCLKKWAKKVCELNQNKDKQLDALKMFTDYIDSLSDSDLLSNSLFGSENQLVLDACSPSICDKELKEYPLAYKIIEAKSASSYHDNAQNLSLYIRSRARNLLQESQKLILSPEINVELTSPSENQVIDLIRKKSISSSETLPREKFGEAFGPISHRTAQLNFSTHGNSGYFEASQFNGTQRIISEDLAPYVRGILANDARLQRDREKISNSVNEGGPGGKKRRTTRAAMSALEGRRRSETRPESYFDYRLNENLVEKTGISYWNEALIRLQEQQIKNSM